jgi:hypothetical protein
MDSRPPLRTYYERAVSKYMSSSRGRCSTCGFLANAMGDEDLEIRAAARETGMDATGKVPLGFWCYVIAQPIRDDLGDLIQSGKTEREAVLEIFQKDRKCDDWYPYRPGASPLWHYEDMRMMYLELERQRHDERLEDQRREFQTALAEQRQEFDNNMANRDAAENRRSNKLVIAITITGIFIAAIIGGIQIWLAAHAPAVLVHVVAPGSPAP